MIAKYFHFIKSAGLYLLVAALVTLVVLLGGCSKEVAVSDIDFQKQLLAGTGKNQNTKRSWRLDSMAMAGVAVRLSQYEKNYTKIFSFDGNFSDSDGFIGSWELKTINELDQTIDNSASGTKLVTSYEIVNINSVRLVIKTKGATETSEYFFVIAQ